MNTSDIQKNVTVMMTTYNNFDFTESALFALRSYYPKIRVILADGGSTDRTLTEWQNCADDFVMIKNGKIEDCRNAASQLIETDFILTMDNDAKVLAEEAIPLLMEPFETKNVVAQTGAYCVKVVDYKSKRGYCGTIFNDIMECDWCPAYLSLHRTFCWHLIGGMPKEWYYGPPPFETSERNKRCNNGGDASISKHYQKHGYKIFTPRKRVPVVHWGTAGRWTVQGEMAKWWMTAHNHKRIEPLNDWEKHESETN